MRGEAPPPAPMRTLADVMAHVGFLLLQWGQLETHLAGAPAPAQFDAIRLMRNTLCHGLNSGSADPRTGREPHVRCRTREGSIVTYTWTDLDEAIRFMEREVWALKHREPSPPRGEKVG